jgi:prepilin-type N-terminal cleavage/methylation domain-containing protein
MLFKINSGKKLSDYGKFAISYSSLTRLRIKSTLLSSFSSIMKKNNRGFTLVEILIAAAMMGGLSLVLMQMNKTTVKSTAKSQFDTDVLLTTNEINGILSNPVQCLATFKTTATPASINSGKYYISSSSSAPSQGYGNSGLKIASYTLTVGASANDGILTIIYQNKNILKGSSGPTSINKTINLYIEGVPGTITKCRALSTSTTDIWTHGTVTDANNIFYNGGVRTGDETQTIICDSSTEGTQRYNKTIHSMEYCGYNAGLPVPYGWFPMGGGSTSGQYSFFDIATCPSGWIVADGNNGTVDLRGEFIRGWDNGRGADPGRTIGSWQEADPGRTIGSWQEASVLAQTANYGGNIQWDWTGDPISPRYGAYNKYENTNTATYSNTGYNGSWRSRPRNVALLVCKKL